MKAYAYTANEFHAKAQRREVQKLAKKIIMLVFAPLVFLSFASLRETRLRFRRWI
jgi:hypothetical protein